MIHWGMYYIILSHKDSCCSIMLWRWRLHALEWKTKIIKYRYQPEGTCMVLIRWIVTIIIIICAKECWLNGTKDIVVAQADCDLNLPLKAMQLIYMYMPLNHIWNIDQYFFLSLSFFCRNDTVNVTCVKCFIQQKCRSWRYYLNNCTSKCKPTCFAQIMIPDHVEWSK